MASRGHLSTWTSEGPLPRQPVSEPQARSLGEKVVPNHSPVTAVCPSAHTQPWAPAPQTQKIQDEMLRRSQQHQCPRSGRWRGIFPAETSRHSEGLGLEGREAWRPTEKALRGTGAVTQACRSLLTRGPREFLAQAALCVEDSYRRRQTAPFTDICQPPSQPGSWVSTGRRRPVSGHQATPEGQALLTQCRAGHRLPRDPVSVCTGGRRPRCAHAAPASLPPSLAPSFFPSLLLSLPPSLAPSLPPAGVKASFPPQTCALQQDFNGY